MSQGTYFLTPVEVHEGGKLQLSLPRALVSRSGIYQLFGESEFAHRAFLDARVFRVEFGGRSWAGRLVREQGPPGSHYNLRLIGLDEEADLHMGWLLRRIGFASPWKREFARLPVASMPEKSEHPVTVLFPRVVGQTPCEVLNFSAHGLFFEFPTSGISLGEYVGQKIRFHIVTTKGRRIHDVEGRIARIYDEMIAPGKLIRGLGVKFINFPSASDAAYKDVLLGVLEVLKTYS
jgi:PilZ domain